MVEVADVEIMDWIDQSMASFTEGKFEKLENDVKVMDGIQTEDAQVSLDDTPKGDTKPEKTSYSSEELDFGDMPNGKIRYEKEREKRLALEEEIARLKGEKEALQSKIEPEEDPTEYMSDEEKREYLKEIANNERVAELEKEIRDIKTTEAKKELKDIEERFWKDSGLDRNVWAPKLFEFLKADMDIAKKVLDKKLSMKQVFAMMNPDKVFEKPKVQDAKKVFGSSPSEPIPAQGAVTKQDTWDEAVSILRDPNSKNKDKAIEAMNAEITASIFNF